MSTMLSRKSTALKSLMSSEGYGWLIREASNQFVFYMTMKYRLKSCGSWTTIEHPFTLRNPRNIEIGTNTRICAYGILAVEPDNLGEKPKGALKIGDSVYIGRSCGIGANRCVTIENNVLIADRVFISDYNHRYDDITQPIGEQWISEGNPIRIGRGSWIGTGTFILPGIQIGRNAVIAAGAVVTENVEDFTVVGGNPAKVLKRYDREKGIWGSSLRRK